MNSERLVGNKKAIPPNILIVDDEPDIIELLELTLARMGMDVASANCVGDAKQMLKKRQFQLCITDMRLPDGDGLDLVKYIAQQCADLPVAVITAHGSAENAVAALKAGAFDYLSKPVSLKQLRELIKSALSLPPVQCGPVISGMNQRLLLGESPPMRQLRATIEKLSRSQASVYIGGESGSGKELAARMIHEKSARRTQPFVAVNCGAIPENLMESEFFGYKKGAFTGADKDHDGFFLSADGGTLFLDEVADLPLAMQVKLLRVIQERQVRRIGETQEKSVDVRIISATHKSLAQCVESGQFRQDLYYRLNVIELNMPALREMREDIPLIVQAVMTRLCQETGRPPCSFKEKALEVLMNYDFPGNVRELENILERTLALCPDSDIGEAELQLQAKVKDFSRLAPDAQIRETGVTQKIQPVIPPVSDTLAITGQQALPLQDFLDKLERDSIVNALMENKYNRTRAAKILGITVRSLRYRMERLGLSN